MNLSFTFCCLPYKIEDEEYFCEDRQNMGEKKEAPKKKKRIILNILLVVCILCVIVSGYMILSQLQEVRQGNAVYDDVRALAPAATTAPQSSDDADEEPEDEGYVAPDFDALLAKNADIVGWLNIPDTLINYPVMQAADNYYYLYKDFNKAHLKQGSIFADYRDEISPLGRNITLYGHNMGYGRTEMFSTLVEYKNEDYNLKHSTIQFDTPEGSGRWEIAAVYQYDVSELETYNFSKSLFSSEEDFLQFAETAQNRSLYTTGVEIKEGDRLLTLSTCDRTFHGENGRLIIVAVLRDGTLAEGGE